jgi:hypothetical protein
MELKRMLTFTPVVLSLHPHPLLQHSMIEDSFILAQICLVTANRT